eukprot:5911153-Pleurochrysis_carterae.AAC.5
MSQANTPTICDGSGRRGAANNWRRVAGGSGRASRRGGSTGSSRKRLPHWRDTGNRRDADTRCGERAARRVSGQSAGADRQEKKTSATR